MFKFLRVCCCLFLLQFGLAEISNFERASIFWEGSVIRFSVPVMRDGAAVYVPLNELASKLNLKVTYDAREYLSSVKRISDNREVTFQNSRSKDLALPVIAANNFVYAPLNELLWAFGYFVEHDGYDNYYITRRLTSVSWEKQTLILRGDAPLRVSPSVASGGYQLLLPNTILNSTQNNKINLADGVIDSIEYTQNDLLPGLVRVFIRTNGNPPPYTVEQSADNYILRFDYPRVAQTAKSTGFSSNNALWLPEEALSKRENIDMVIRGNPQNVKLESRANILYVDFDVFGQLGCQLSRVNGAYVFTDNRGLTYRLENNLISGADFQEKYELLKKNNQDYFPLVQTLKIIGYAAYLDDVAKKIYINPRIYELTNENNRVIIRANDKLLPGNIQYLDNPPRALIDIPNSSYDVSLNILRLNDKNAKTVRAAQFDKGIVRIVADLADGKNKPVLSFEEDGRALVLLFGAPRLTKINMSADKNDTLNLSFMADTIRLNNYTVSKLNNPDRLVLDFPGVSLGLDNETGLKQGAVDRVRSSQFSWEPMTARIVLDLNDSYVFYRRDADGSLLLYTQLESSVSPLQTFTPIAEIKTPATPAQSSDVLRGLRVAVIVGHGGNDPGAVTRQGDMEKDLDLELAKKLQILLREKGAIALLSREGDENVSLDKQAEFAIRNKADVLISIHLNFFVNESANGTESFYYKPIDQALARCVHDEIVKQAGLRDRGLQKAQMHNLNHTTMPGVLIEPLFISNRKEMALIKSQDFQMKLMRAVVTGIENYERSKKN